MSSLWEYTGITLKGKDGATGARGAAGVEGSTGPTGRQGPPGAASQVTGFTGPAGPTGRQGPPGADSSVTGFTGPAGPTGLRGPQGAGLAVRTSITINSSYITFEANTQGSKNTTINNLIGFSPVGGDSVFIAFTDQTYLYLYNTANNWIPTGTAIANSATGATGATGPRGTVGAAGSRIYSGVTNPVLSGVSATAGDYFLDVSSGKLWLLSTVDAAQYLVRDEDGIAYNYFNNSTSVTVNANGSIIGGSSLCVLYKFTPVDKTQVITPAVGSLIRLRIGFSTVPGAFVNLGTSCTVGSNQYGPDGSNSLYILSNTPIGGTDNITYVPGAFRTNLLILDNAPSVFTDNINTTIGPKNLDILYNTQSTGSTRVGEAPRGNGIGSDPLAIVTNGITYSSPTTNKNLSLAFFLRDVTFRVSSDEISRIFYNDSGYYYGSNGNISRINSTRVFNVYLVQDSANPVPYNRTFSSLYTFTLDLNDDVVPETGDADKTVSLYLTTTWSASERYNTSPGYIQPSLSGSSNFNVMIQDVTGDSLEYQLNMALVPNQAISSFSYYV